MRNAQHDLGAFVWVNTGREEYYANLVITPDNLKKEGQLYIQWVDQKTREYVPARNVRIIEASGGRRSSSRRRGAAVAAVAPPRPQQEEEVQEEEGGEEEQEEPAAIDLTLDDDDNSTGGNNEDSTGGSSSEEEDLGVNNDSNPNINNEQEQNEPVEEEEENNDNDNHNNNETICVLDSDSSDSEEEVDNDNNSINNKQDEENDNELDSSDDDGEEAGDLPGEEEVESSKHGWTCPRCTFEHQFPGTRCVMCQSLRTTKDQMAEFVMGKPIPESSKINASLSSDEDDDSVAPQPKRQRRMGNAKRRHRNRRSYGKGLKGKPPMGLKEKPPIGLEEKLNVRPPRVSPLPEETEDSDPSVTDDDGPMMEEADIDMNADGADMEDTITHSETVTVSKPPSTNTRGYSEDKPYLMQDYEFCCAICRCGQTKEGFDDWVPLSTREFSFRFCMSQNQGGGLHRVCCHPKFSSECNENWGHFSVPISKGEQAYQDLFETNAKKVATMQTSTNNNTKYLAYKEEGAKYEEAISQELAKEDEANEETEQDSSQEPTERRQAYYREGAEYRLGLWGRLLRMQERDEEVQRIFHITRPVNLAMTAPCHQKNLSHHKKLIAQKHRAKQNGITVVDFFAGHGTGLVALKKNGIRVNKYIVVEWDQVAVHVLKCNHDPQYRKSLGLAPRGPFDEETGDGTKFVYIENFEDVCIEAIYKDHGPIDLVLGSPECKDYSKVNANGKGVDGESGNQHVQLGKMILEMESLQQQRWQHKLYFLVENVSTTKKDKAELEEAYGKTPTIDLDACKFSPCHRLRSFHTNLPLVGSEGYLKGDDDYGLSSGAKMCLEDGYALPADWLLDENNEGSKCLTFMASKQRIDDRAGRMRVAKFWYDVDDNGERKLKGASRYMNVEERSRIMGYHDGYVREPLRLLFQALTPAFRGGRVAGFDWFTDLRKEYHCFAGLTHRFTGKDQSLELAPPTIKGKPQYCFDESMYGKHLIGNAYSVPVVARLLQPLKDIFVSGKKYEGLQYEYYWVRRFSGATD